MAALSYGTESIPKVDNYSRNVYVALAKMCTDMSALIPLQTGRKF